MSHMQCVQSGYSNLLFGGFYSYIS
jgi:hypothetical protein